MVARQRDDRAKSLIPRRVGQDKLRRRVMTNLCGSARRHLPVQLNRGNVAALLRPEFISKSRRRRVGSTQRNCAPNEKGCAPLRVSRLRHKRISRRSNNSSSTVVRLQEPLTPRAMDSRKVETDHQKRRHRHIRNNFWRNQL